ncbi:MAG TPA: hypoxanthine phosphoribosyltransferase [Actinomycetota bacterium]|nr:hypoxanthine phosphoribosyltransferase [Actinomycetota bacterium]
MTDLGPAPDFLIDADGLRERVLELGSEIAPVYAAEPPVLVSVLKGSSVFLSDLVRALPIELEIDFMSISSYGGAQQSGVVRILKDLDTDVEGRDVLIVEDIVDTGLTLNYLRRSLGARRPRTLRCVTLLDKAARRIVPVPVEWVGFEIPDVFVLGYGLDYHGIYRNIQGLIAVNDVARLAAQPDLYVPLLWPQQPGGSPSEPSA